MSIILSATVAGIAWICRRVSNEALLAILVPALAVAILGLILSVPLFPWTDLLTLVVALTGGILIGRAVPPRFSSLLILLIMLSVLDMLQILLPSGPGSTSASGPSVGYYYGMFVVQTHGYRSAVGIFDLLLAATISTHAQRRAQPLWRAIVPAPIGLLLADGVVRLTSVGNLPLMPFLTGGWLLSQIRWPQPEPARSW